MNEKDKIDFIALSVHKLKTPMSSIKLSLEMLLEGDFGTLNDEQKKILTRTLERNNYLVYLVNDFLNLAKVDGKSYVYKLAPVNLENLLKLVIDCEKEEIAEKSITVNIEKPTVKIPKIKADKEKLFLAIQNIFDNAVKYSKLQGGINISLNVDSSKVEIKIQDFGIGVIESEKEKLFTEFFRGKNAIEAQPMGSGLGLCIAKNIIEGHHGKIWFESQENKGSTFFMSLPIA